MNIRRFINQNSEKIWKIIGIIAFAFFIIKGLNFYYEKSEEAKKQQMSESLKNNNNKEQEIINFKTESNTVKETISSFVHYCNNKNIQEAYDMLTPECKDELYPTLEDFEKYYINKKYNIKRTFEVEKWASAENISIYLVTLYGDILATGGTENRTQEYMTFVKNENGTFKMNISNFIYRKNMNVKQTTNGITVKIDKIAIYEEYEQFEITVNNTTSKSICLTGNENLENIYIKDSKGIKYSSLNSEFDYSQIVMEPNTSQKFSVKFNKVFSTTDRANCLVLNEVVLDNEYRYSNRISINLEY